MIVRACEYEDRTDFATTTFERNGGRVGTGDSNRIHHPNHVKTLRRQLIDLRDGELALQQEIGRVAQILFCVLESFEQQESVVFCACQEFFVRTLLCLARDVCVESERRNDRRKRQASSENQKSASGNARSKP